MEAILNFADPLDVGLFDRVVSVFNDAASPQVSCQRLKFPLDLPYTRIEAACELSQTLVLTYSRPASLAARDGRTRT